MDVTFHEKKRIILKVGIIFLVIIALYYTFTAWYHHYHRQITLYGNVDIRDVNLGFRVSGRLMEWMKAMPFILAS